LQITREQALKEPKMPTTLSVIKAVNEKLEALDKRFTVRG
jgi:hypothetical protein